MVNADVLTVCGTAIDPAFRKDLNSGINLVAYVPQMSSTPEDYFADLLAADNLLFARGYDGGYRIFDPTLPPFLNTLTSVDNGFGYEIRVITGVSGGSWLTGGGDEVAFRGGDESGRANTLNYDVVAGISNLPSTAVGGSVYLVTEDGEVVGEMEILTDGYLMTTPVYGYDASQLGASSLQAGDPAFFQYEDQVIDAGLIFSGDKQIRFLEVSFKLGDEDVSEELELAVTELNVYPNPFQTNLTVEYRLAREGEVVVQLLNANGQLIDVLQPQAIMPGGEHRIFYNGHRLSAGTYLIQLWLDGKPVARMPLIRQR
jgi:hypothetical protein